MCSIESVWHTGNILGELPGVLFIVVVNIEVYALCYVIKITLNHITCSTPAEK